MPEFILDKGSTADAKGFSDLSSFVQGYIEAMFFTETGNDDDLEDANSGELSDESIASIVADCDAFEKANEALLSQAYDLGENFKYPYDATRAGHDFWFTRCGHGVGFWSRDLGDTGEALSEAARKAGSAYLYRGDDGKLYHSKG
jgi:hypothetical protein